jgi:HTH-type transcriptional regulator, transcriptional repressor of NAD biosynthesis genes
MLKVALLGAESTGKTWLAKALARRAAEHQLALNLQVEPLRLWCEQLGRTPTAAEQWPLARAHAITLSQAFHGRADWLVADTTPLQTAAYSAYYFEDHGLNAFAAQFQRQFDVTLLMGLDLAWQADPGQRSGPESQIAVDQHLRTLLCTYQIPFSVIYGHGDQRLERAWHLLQMAANIPPSHHILGVDPLTDRQVLTHGWTCSHCGDPDCERRLFRHLTLPDDQGKRPNLMPAPLTTPPSLAQ